MSQGLKVPVCDLVDSHGATYIGCRWLIHGVTDKNNLTYVPPPSGFANNLTSTLGAAPEVLISFPDGARPMPIVVGSIYTGASGIKKRISKKRKKGSTAPIHTQGAQDRDLDKKNHEDDQFFIRNRIRVTYAHTGRWELDLKGTGEIAGFAFHKDSWLRLSHQLTSDYTSPGGASEYVILGEKFLTHFQELVEKYNTCASRLNAVIDQIAVGLPVSQGKAAWTGLTKAPELSSKTDSLDKRKDFFAGVLRVSKRSVKEQPNS